MRILAFLSGGKDSTSLCYYLLTNFPHDVHIHHVVANYHHQSYAGDRAEIEQLVTSKVVAWLRENCRPFEFSESRLDMQIDGYPAAPSDHATCAYIGGSLINKGLGDVLATGRNATDCGARSWDHVKAAYEIFQTVTSPAIRLRNDGKDRTSNRLVPREVYWVNPIIHWTKAEEMARVPRDLWSLAVSCRNPVRTGDDIVTCLEREAADEGVTNCRTCHRVKMAMACIEEGMSVEQANDWLCANPPPHAAPAGKYFEGYEPWPISMEDIEQIETEGKRYF